MVTPSTASSLLSLYISASPCPSFRNYLASASIHNFVFLPFLLPSRSALSLPLPLLSLPCPSALPPLSSPPPLSLTLVAQRGTAADLVATVIGLQNQSVYLAVYSLVDSPPFPQFSIRLEYGMKARERR